jgi:hypothetical protein
MRQSERLLDEAAMQDELPLLLAMPGNLLTIGGLAGPAADVAAGLVGIRLLPCELSRIDIRGWRPPRPIGVHVLLVAFSAELKLRNSCRAPEVLPPPAAVLLLLLCVPAADRPTAGFTAATAAGAGSAATLLVLLELLMLAKLLGSLDFPWMRPFAEAWFSSWMYLFDLPWSPAAAGAEGAAACGTAATAAGDGGCGLGT